MSFNRLVFGVVVAGYLAVLHENAHLLALAGMAVYLAGSLGIFLHILRFPEENLSRRLFAMAWDFAAVAVEMHIGDATTALLFPLFLWIIFGNGFRFGAFYLRVAMLGGIAAFLAVAFTTPFWRTHPSLSAGLVIGLLILPLYAGVLIRKLSAARQQAEAANRAKSQFLASVSHEFRTPLNAIIGVGAMLLDTSLDEEQTDMARTVRDAGKALLWQINGILDFSRIEAGKMPFTVVDFDLLAMLNEARAMLAAQAQGKALWFGLQISPRVPKMVHGDELHLREVLLNLCGNALKFTESGSVVVTVDAEPRADSRLDLSFAVSDSGIGIAPEARERIFEGFAQADETIANRFGGTGLGLAICKRLVTHLGGEIGVESELGKGSRFWFRLPMHAASAEGLSPEALARLPVLLLADSDARASMLLRELNGCGARAQQFDELGPLLAALRSTTGRQALRHALVLISGRRTAQAPESLAQALRRLDPFGKVTLVLLSNEAIRQNADPDAVRLFNMVLPALPSREELEAALVFAESTLLPVPREATSQPEDRHAAPGLRILVADDNRTNQRVIAKILERAGHTAVVVDDGEAALDALESEDFALVLMDLNMPRMDGIEATKLYRMGELGGPRLPIVALTADATKETVTRCIDAGMTECLTKPIEPGQLLETIATLVDGAAAAQQPPSEAQQEAATVTDISTHPQFRVSILPVLDKTKLQELERLGGPDFVNELVEGFLEDGAKTLQAMKIAAAKGDVASFRSHAHTMCSGAANVGARRVDELCRPWAHASDAALAERAEADAARVEDELARVQQALARLQAEGGQVG